MKEKTWYDPGKDAQLQKPYRDVEEWREEDGVRCWYVHGGFEGTTVKFSFCFPEKEKFQGRFYQYLSPFPGANEEMASLGKHGADDMIAFALNHGAYFVETNMGASESFANQSDPTMVYRSSAASAEYSRQVAQEFYGCSRPYGYVFGGSGGSYKTFACIENTTAFDGAVPYVPGCPAALPNVIFVRSHALRILRYKMEYIMDAVRPGCEHGLYDGLNEEEAAALREVTAMGYPPEAWLQYWFMGDGSLAVLSPTIGKIDPSYYEDFWTKEGYLGTEKDSSAVRDRIQMRMSVKELYVPTQEEIEADQKYREKTLKEFDGRNGVDDAWKKMIGCADGEPWLTLSDNLPPDFYSGGLTVTFESGKAEGKKLNIGKVEEGRLYIGSAYGFDSINEVLQLAEPGDQVYLDNSDYIALQTYHRHQVPAPEFQVWDQFRKKDGTPKYPQRPFLLCEGFAVSGCGSRQSGDFHGKMICISCLADDSAFPWMADWYYRKVKEVKGAEADENFRLWYMEHCYHGPQIATVDETTVTSYGPALYQALLDVSDWVERGIEPVKTTEYRVKDGQVLVAADAKSRRGIQPVVSMTANRQIRACVKTGQTVELKAVVTLPEGAGEITGAEISYEGKPSYDNERELEISPDKKSAVIRARCRYERPGTYFPCVRVKSNEHGDQKDIYTQIQNIASARVVVEEA